MARPTNKEDLIEEATLQYQKLLTILDGMDETVIHAPFSFEDRDHNVRDVLAHLHEWHRMMKEWYTVGVINKDTPVIPGEGYTWKTLPELNLKIWEFYQDVSLEDIMQRFKTSHEEIMTCIQEHSNDELFKRNIYPWTKTTTLGAYFVSSTASHYVWAQKKIRKHIRTLNV